MFTFLSWRKKVKKSKASRSLGIDAEHFFSVTFPISNEFTFYFFVLTQKSNKKSQGVPKLRD